MTIRTLCFTLALIGAVPMAAVAQQPAETGPATQTATPDSPPAGAATAAPTSGPRIAPARARIEPTSLADGSAAPMQGRRHTFTISTLALVLGVVILVLLVT